MPRLGALHCALSTFLQKQINLIMFVEMPWSTSHHPIHGYHESSRVTSFVRALIFFSFSFYFKTLARSLTWFLVPWAQKPLIRISPWSSSFLVLLSLLWLVELGFTFSVEQPCVKASFHIGEELRTFRAKWMAGAKYNKSTLFATHGVLEGERGIKIIPADGEVGWLQGHGVSEFLGREFSPMYWDMHSSGVLSSFDGSASSSR